MVVPLKQFRDRYPTATMVSELLGVQGDQFLVKVTIQAETTGTVTGMAAAPTLEVAEDRARQRALSALGMDLPSGSSLGTSAPPTDPLPELFEDWLQPEADTSLPVLKAGPESNQNGERTVAAPGDDPKATPPTGKEFLGGSKPIIKGSPSKAPSAATESPTASPQVPSVKAAQGETDSPRSPTPSFPSDLPLPDPVNLSDVIAQTDVELRRLRWSVSDGREYLEQTYGKRSRHELSDEELLAFLLYLESLPDPNG